MRVLLLSQYYYPEPVEKVHDLARRLQAMGHEVQVLTGFPCYPRGVVYDGYRQSLGFEETIEGVRVSRIPQFPDHSRSALRRAAYYLSFCLSAVVFGLFRVRKADVMLVYQSALPIGLAAWILGTLRRIPVVLDVVDLWPESVSESGMLRSPWLLRMLRSMSRFVYTRAAHVNAVTDGFRDRLKAMSVPEPKLSVIHSWLPEETYARAAPNPDVAAELGIAGCFSVIFAGNMGPAQDLETVVRAAALLRDLPHVRLVLIGDGLDQPRLKERARELGLTNVLFPGRFPPSRMAEFYAVADALLVHLKPDALSEVSIPSKTFAYMAAGRPVLMAVKGDAARFVEDNGFGVAVPPSDPAALADAIRRLALASPEERAAYGRAGVEAYESRYSSPVQSRRMADVLERVATERSRRAA